MTTPLDDYLLEKEANAFTQHLGPAVTAGLGTALAAGAVAATGMAASHIYDAVTKARDFKSMLASPFNRDLHEMHQSRPQEFNAAFSSLRSINPDFSKDPMVAGSYMRRMMEFSPTAAGGVLVEALGHRDRFPVSAISESFMRGGQQGAQSGFLESMKEHAQLGKEERGRTKDIELESFKSRLTRANQEAQAAQQLANQQTLAQQQQAAQAAAAALQHQRGMQQAQYKSYLDLVGRHPYPEDKGMPMAARERIHNERIRDILQEMPTTGRNVRRFGS